MAQQSVYYIFHITKDHILAEREPTGGRSTLNRSANSSDLGFDSYTKDAAKVNPPVSCTGKHIGSFYMHIVPTGDFKK